MGKIVVNKFILQEFLHFKEHEVKLNSINLFTGENYHVLNLFKLINEGTVDNFSVFDDSKLSFTLEFKDNYTLNYEFYIDDGEIFDLGEKNIQCALYCHIRKKRSKYFIFPEFQIINLREDDPFKYGEYSKDDSLLASGENFYSFLEYISKSIDFSEYYENILNAYTDVYTNVKELEISNDGIRFMDEDGNEVLEKNLHFLFILTSIFIPSIYTWDVGLIHYPEYKLNDREIIKMYQYILHRGDNQIIITSNSKLLIEKCRRDRIYLSKAGEVGKYIK